MRKNLLVLCLVLALVIGLTGCGGGADGEKVIMGSKSYTENLVLAHIMADMIEAETDLTVERKFNLGGSNVAFKALESDEIQLNPDYTGTIVANYYHADTGSAEETLQAAKEFAEQDGYKLLEPFGLNNTYALVVTQETAEKYNLKTYSDLAEVSGELILGCDFEFQDRKDGYPGLQEVYNMHFDDVKGMSHGIKYRSLNEGEVEVIDAFSTDGQIMVYDLVVLEDDLEFFPPYHGLPIVRQDTLDEYPEIEDALNKLAGAISDDEMQKLNAQVDNEGLKAQAVAHDFLVSKGLIKE